MRGTFIVNIRHIFDYHILWHVHLLPGFQGGTAPCATVPNLQRLLRFIPGKVSDAYFNTTDELFRRCHAGDTTMIREISDNAQSSGPIQTIMRDAQKRETGTKVDTDVHDWRKTQRLSHR